MTTWNQVAARGIGIEKLAISLFGPYLYMFGPNPVPDKGDSLYWSGHEYSGVQLRTDIPFVRTTKKGDLESADYAGYQVIPQALALRMGLHLQERSQPKR